MYILQTMDCTVLEQHLGNQSLQEFEGIILLKNQSKLLEQYLYVGLYSDGLRLLDRCTPGTSVTMFLSAEDVNHTTLPSCGRHNIIVSALDIFDLYNRINIIIQNYHCWTNTLQNALCSGQTLPQLLNTASGMIQAPLYLLNPGCKLIVNSSSDIFEHPLGAELSQHGGLSLETVQKLQDTASSDYHDGYRVAILNGIHYHLYEIQTGSRHLVTMLLAENPAMEAIDYHHLLLDFAEIILHPLLENLETLLNQDALFAAFLRDLMEERLAETDEIQNRLDMLAYPVRSFCCFVLIRMEEAAEHTAPLGIFMQQLQDIFPDTNMTIFQNDIAILYSQEDRPAGKIDIDYGKLYHVLDQFHAHAGISNASRHRPRLQTLYTIASATIRLGRALHRFSASERIFSYEDYSMYYIIDLCAQKYMELHHHNDLIYLIHPSIIKICRYDAQHKSNLRDVLYYYLLSGCNLNRTAQAIYMHRNTILNKLNKISEIAEIPLEDGYTRHRMIMSCLIMRYYEEYIHMTPRL